MKKNLTACLFFLVAGSLFIGCAQKDSAVGSDLAPGLNDIYPQDTTLYPQVAQFFEVQATTGSSPFLYLGHDQGYDADVLLKFSPGTALPDSYLVDSLIVWLYMDSLLNPDVNPMPVSAALLNRSYTWAEIGITWNGLDAEPVYRYLTPDPTQFDAAFAEFSIEPMSADSDSFSFALPAPDSLLRAWEETAFGGKTLDFNNGIYLLSDKSQDFIMRFASAENNSVARRPQLKLYLSVVDTADTTGAEPQDTVITLYAGGDAFLAQSETPLDSAYFYLGNAVACRSLFYFNVEGLFPAYGVAIQRAEVVLHADTTNSLNYSHINSAFFLEMADTSWFTQPATALTQLGSPALFILNSQTATLTLNLTNWVLNWISAPGSNQGIMIKSSNEFYDISRTAFFGLNAPDSLRPHLRIVYLDGTP